MVEAARNKIEKLPCLTGGYVWVGERETKQRMNRCVRCNFISSLSDSHLPVRGHSPLLDLLDTSWSAPGHFANHLHPPSEIQLMCSVQSPPLGHNFLPWIWVFFHLSHSRSLKAYSSSAPRSGLLLVSVSLVERSLPWEWEEKSKEFLGKIRILWSF